MDRRRHLRALTRGAAAVVFACAAATAFFWHLRRGGGASGGSDPAAHDGGSAGRDGEPPLRALRFSRVFVANRGKLVGAWSGFAWVAAAMGVQIETPQPCDERQCFRGTDGLLCTRGTVTSAPGSLPRDDDENQGPWAVKIGLDVRRDGGAWGSNADAYVSIEYRGATHLRFAAHRVGDGEREYCIDDYGSGEVVQADRFRASCWQQGGEVLATFDDIDKFILELPARDEVTSFDYCLTAIHVASPDHSDAASDAAPAVRALAVPRH